MPTKKFKFYVFNIKLQSPKTGEERTQAYEDLLKRLTDKRFYTKLNKNEAITMYPPFQREINGLKYFYGNIGKGISFFDEDEVRVLNNNTVGRETVDKDKFYKPAVGEYIFVPSIHRFAMMKTTNGLTVGDFERFLREHLVKFIKPEEKIEIDFEKEPSIIEEIFEAQAVYKLSYEISYTNSDALPAQGELFDELLKENHIGKLTVNAQSDHDPEGMNIKDVNFLGGGIEVAKNNGVIKTATIKPKNGGRVKNISNQQKPLIQELELLNENENKPERWFQKLRGLYRTN